MSGDHARWCRVIVPGQRLPKGMIYVSPPLIESIRCARRTSPDGTVLFNLVAEVTQSCTVTRGGEPVELLAGCTIVIDPHSGQVRTSGSDSKRLNVSMVGNGAVMSVPGGLGVRARVSD